MKNVVENQSNVANKQPDSSRWCNNCKKPGHTKSAFGSGSKKRF